MSLAKSVNQTQVFILGQMREILTRPYKPMHSQDEQDAKRAEALYTLAQAFEQLTFSQKSLAPEADDEVEPTFDC